MLCGQYNGETPRKVLSRDVVDVHAVIIAIGIVSSNVDHFRRDRQVKDLNETSRKKVAFHLFT